MLCILENVKKQKNLIEYFSCGFQQELQQQIGVAIYGRCGNMTCGQVRSLAHAQQLQHLAQDDTGGSDGDPCKQVLETGYMFVLTFENAICKDYITEKPYLALQKGIIS